MDTELEDIEVDLLLEGVHRRYGFDFRDYSRSSLKRRIGITMNDLGVPNATRLLEKVLHEDSAIENFLLRLSINTTSFFRDPEFFLSFRKSVVPILRTYPFVRIWICGCSSGEEVYSMAILLEEEGLGRKCKLYATDMNEVVIAVARKGIFPLTSMKEYTDNYINAGGTRAFSDYYTAKYDNAIFNIGTKNDIVFSQHNLASDGSFNAFNVILCRNVMIYFNSTLRERVHDLVLRSLVPLGFLCLGKKEMMRFEKHGPEYEEFDENNRIYRRKN